MGTNLLDLSLFGRRARVAVVGAFVLLSVGLALGGCSLFDSGVPFDGSGDPTWDAAPSSALVGDPVRLSVSGHLGDCVPTWQINPVPVVGGAYFLGTGRAATLVGYLSARYSVTFHCGSTTLSRDVQIFGQEVSVQAAPPVLLQKECYDAVFTERGRLLCVNMGVGVLDAASGQVLGHTAESSPIAWGIDTQGDLFATASVGCSSCGPDKGAIPPGALLYRLGGPTGDTPQLLARLGSDPANEVKLAGSLLYLTTDTSITRFDISDPAHPKKLDCLESAIGDALPREAGGSLLLLNNNELDSFDLKSFGSCASPPVLAPVATVPLATRGMITPPVWIERGGLLYAALSRGLVVLDATNGQKPALVFAAEPSVGSPSTLAGIGIDTRRPDGKLFTVRGEHVLIYDLANPIAPRPVGVWRPQSLLVMRFGVANGKFFAVSAGKLWSLEVR